MLPTNPRGTVYINPNFKTTHINPKFLRPQCNVPNSIHINPAFLQKQQEQQQQSTLSNGGAAVARVPNEITSDLPLNQHQPQLSDDYTPNSSNIASNLADPIESNTEAKIIPKSRTKLVRNSTVNSSALSLHKKQSPFADRKPASNSSGQLLKIGLRKLIRPSAVKVKESLMPPASSVRIINSKFKKQNVMTSTDKFSNIKTDTAKAISPTQKYKIDRRIPSNPTILLNGIKKKSFVSQFALCRSNMKLTPKKVIIGQRNVFKKISTKEPNIKSSHIKLELLNINGVLYKSTRTKLQRKSTSDHDQKKFSEVPASKPFAAAAKKPTGNRTLFVRGNKFVLDKSGLKLTKIASEINTTSTSKLVSRSAMKRIDIGGLTYIAKSNNVFVRTDMHVTRNYLSTTKQRSINTLHNRMVKTNICCPIYRKLGKCKAFEKGKCPKLHEKKHVAICSKFLKGECTAQNCLLSHNVNFSKMPVCKFFLEGLCVRNDCPYLHRKLGKTVQICPEFLKGYCSLADKCPKRHEFLCPDFESKGKCEKANCLYCKKRIKQAGSKARSKVEQITKPKKKINIQISDAIKTVAEGGANDCETSRYFIGTNDALQSEGAAAPTVEVKSDNQSTSSEDEVSDNDGSEGDANDNSTKSRLLQRPKLGILPAYIPL